MQGTQYAPRESILCMEHFVALQRIMLYIAYQDNFLEGYVLTFS